MLRAMSSARPTTRLALMPGAGSSSYIVTTGPVRTAVISPFTLKSSSTFSSRRALRSSASLSSLGPLSTGGSASRSRLGRVKGANMSPCAVLPVAARLGGAEGSLISGARRGRSSAMGAGAVSPLAARRGRAGASSSSSSASNPSAKARAFCLRPGSGRRRISPASEPPPRNSGRLISTRQSIAKIRVSSATPTPRQVSARPRITQPSAASPKRAATARIAPAPSRPARPPDCAGSVPPGPSKTRLRTVAIRAMAMNSSAAGIHHAVVSGASPFSTSRHSLRALT